MIDGASTTHERIEITKNGRRAAVPMGAEDYDAMRETIAVLSGTELVLAHLRGISELNLDEFLDAEAFIKLLNQPEPRGEAN